MAKARCKCKASECEECPEWIFTFADLVMLMMGFFVILWVLKPPAGKDGVQKQELPVEVLAAIREAFGHVPDPQSKDPVDIHMLLKKLEQLDPMKDKGDGGKTKLEKKGIDGTHPEVEMIRASKTVGTGTKVLFAPGRVDLSPEACAALEAIAKEIRGKRLIFMVKGHASVDDFAEGANEDARMDLSLRRAQAAAQFLVSKGGMERDTLRVQGCSTYEPIAMRTYTGDAQVLNRRVEVIDTAMLVKDAQGNPTTKATSHGGGHEKPQEKAPEKAHGGH